MKKEGDAVLSSGCAIIELEKTIHHWLAQWLPEFLYMLAGFPPMAGTRVSNMTHMCKDEHEGQQTALRGTK